MNRFKAAALGVGAVIVGVVTFRKLRNRRTAEVESSTPTEVAEQEAKAAAEDAKSTLVHAAAAARHGIEAAREREDGLLTHEKTGEDQPKARGRLRRAGKGWIRR